jgi:hypothetical protein
VPPVRRILFVVASGRGDLVDLLQRQFADVADAVEIVSDRRAGERRRRPTPVDNDRRVTDRRQRDVQADLRTIGWALVRRDP